MVESLEISLEYLGVLEITLGTPKTLVRMFSGFSNDNYLFTTSTGKYRLRVPQYSINLDQLLAEQMFLKWATKKSNVIVPLLHLFPLPSGKYISIFPFVNADPKFDLHNEQLLRSAGKVLAEYHLSVDGYKGNLPWKTLSESFRLNALDIRELRTSINEPSISQFTGFWNAVENLLQRMKKMDELLNAELHTSLPHIPCHGDYAPANVLTFEEKVAGLIDFECCRWAPRIYDLSTFLLSLQQSEEYKEFMSSSFLYGYRSVIALSEIELEMIPIFQNIRSLESAKRHFNKVFQGDQLVNAGLVLYWDRLLQT